MNPEIYALSKQRLYFVGADVHTFLNLQLDSDSDGSEIQEILKGITGGRSVPRVFIGGKFIGGGDETAAAAANGSLEKLLTQAGAA
jgi:glutaredoxin-related protein